MTLEKLQQLLAGEPSYRVDQAAQALFQDGVPSFAEITPLPKALRERLAAVPVLSVEPVSLKVSGDRRAHKAILKLADGRRIESVLLNPKPGLWSTCISSQVGCALACSFCATGLMGFTRHLSDEEITDQVLFWRQYLRKEGASLPGEGPARLSNVVYMGMGEPFLNLDNVFASLRRLSDPKAFGLGPRNLSVSTAGVAPAIGLFADAFPQVNLALSLHSARPELRRKLVPLDKAHSLEALQAALKGYFAKTRRKVFVEYIMLDGENDSLEDAQALVTFLRRSGPLQLLHVNLIVFNPTATPHKASQSDNAKAFAELLKDRGVPVTFRKNLGRDIDGACGQLVLSETPAGAPPSPA